MPNIVAVQEHQGEARADSRQLVDRAREIAAELGLSLADDSAETLDDGRVPYMLLAAAMRCALADDTSRAIKLLQLVRTISPESEDINILAVAVSTQISLTMRARRFPKTINPHGEFAVVHYWFRHNIEKVIQGGRIVPFARLAHAVPDFMVEIEGETRPVECKKRFDARALNQLLSYLDVYGASHGYAVGLSLTCSLPEHITFIECPVEAQHD